MNKNQKKIYVYDSFSFDYPILLGLLYADILRGRETYSFEYDDEWLRKTNLTVSIDPELISYRGRQFPTDTNFFGIFMDASPDRWGRFLMQRKERIIAEKENRKPNKLFASDYLINVYDDTRMGGLRFKLDPDGDFLSNDQSMPVPPWTSLRTLEEASRQFEKNENILNEKWLDLLIKPGSSLGGARPKATVIDENGELWIAKFPSKNDENNTGAWEKVVHDLAKMCGLNVPESKLESFSDFGSTFLVKRFDRLGNKRIHFASAMTLLGKTDGASSYDGSSYLEIADFIKSFGVNPKNDLIELWKRIVFNMAVSNTDDHLRNHAFILKQKGWELSPLFDVNPVPFGNSLSLNVSLYDCSISISLARSVALNFGISEKQAQKMSNEILSIVRSNWESIAKKYKITREQIRAMKPAFSACYDNE